MKQYVRILLEGGGEEKPLLLYIRKINLDLDMFTWSSFEWSPCMSFFRGDDDTAFFITEEMVDMQF